VDPTRVGRVAPGEWGIYSAGYRRAADLVVANAEATFDLNTLVFPAIFLYRQFVELSLKDMIGDGRYLENDDRRVGGHDLVQLWRECLPLIRKYVPKVGKDELGRIQELIEGLASLDPSSEASRYPTTKARRSSFDYDAPPVNLDKLHNDMAELADLLDPIGNMLCITQQQEAEFRSEYDDVF
jgi:hypothetical protein